MNASPLPFGAVILVLSWLLVGGVRRLAIAHGILDQPSERSSHAVPTPRGGGAGILVVVLGALLVVAHTWRLSLLIGCIGGCAAVAVVGWVDDRRALSVRIRLVVHVVSAFTVGALAVAGREFTAIASLLFAWWSFWTVTSVNVVNFMDGINGFVASQTAIFAASLIAFGDWSSPLPWCATALLGGCLGFLPWNFPRARVFLGDVGSGSLGFLIAVLTALTMETVDHAFLRAQLPLIPLFGDATVTIIRRWRRGETLTQAHRSHLYQRLANGWLGHVRVTLLYGGAAMLGALVAHIDSPLAWGLAASVYVAVLAVGSILLDRRLSTRTSAREPEPSARREILE